MLTLARNKFFHRYLPTILSVILVATALGAYYIYRESKPVKSAWFATGGTWSYRKPITIDHNKVNQATGTTTPLTNFPVLINLTDTDLKNNASSTGADILFTSSNGTTKLNHEIETYATSTGQLIAWVQIPSLVSTSDTTIYMYFGNATAASQQSATATWDSNYKGVWHLGETSGTAINDSTSNADNGTSTTTPTTGFISGGQSFTAASNNYITLNSVITLANASSTTISAWVYHNTANGNAQYLWSGLSISNSNYNTGVSFNGYQSPTAGYLSYGFQDVGGGFVMSTDHRADKTWTYVVETTQGATVNLYINGVLNVTGSDGFSNPGMSMRYIGATTPPTAGFYNGIIDEVRASNGVARSADWILTEYLNQTSPATFAAVGGLQIQNRSAAKPGEGVVNRGTSGVGWFASGGTWTNRRAITIDHNKINQATGTTTPLTNFPMLFSTTDNELKYTGFAGGKVGRTDGLDMVFTDSDGTTKINYEMESYSSSTGATIAWVQIPSLTSTADKTLYVYYGNAASSDQSSAASTWDSNYKGVWHLPNGTTISGADSLGSGISGHTMNPGSTLTATSGKIDGAGNFNGNAARGNASTSAFTLSATPSIVTFSAWTKITGALLAASRYNIFSTTQANTGQNWSAEIGQGSATGGINRFTIIVPSIFMFETPVNSYPSDGNWHYVTFTRSGTGAGTGRMYIDGVSLPVIESGVQNFIDSGEVKTIGVRTWNSAEPFNGQIDDVRISNSARSSDWVKTEYLNQSSPGTFYALSGSSLQTRSTSIPLLKSRGGIKFH